ncbi:hypothetical protein WA158_005562 [Blastocystis sp. Blastoise]
MASCSIGEYEVIVQRQYMNNPGEIIQLYSDESTNLRRSFVFRDVSSSQQYSTINYRVCLYGNTNYNLELLSENTVSWTEESYVTLIYNKIILANGRLNTVDNERKIILFNLSSLVSSNTDWKYSPFADSVSWKENQLGNWGKEYNDKKIKNTEITTYFRKDIFINGSFSVLQLAVQSQSGFIVYVNGIQVYTYLLPEFNITHTTPSQSIEDSPTYKQILIPQEILASSVSLTTLKIAIELHTNINHPELLSSFDALIYFTNSIDYLDILSPLSIGCSTSHPLSSTACNSLLHYNNTIPIPIQENHASFYISSVSPLYINGYKMKFKNNNIPKECKIYGSNNKNTEWILIDSIDHSSNTTLYKASSPFQYYKYYRLDLSSYSSFDIYSIQFIYLSSSSKINKPRRLEDPTVTINVNMNEYLPPTDLCTSLQINPPFTIVEISPSLPDGLTINEDCYIYGTPVKYKRKGNYKVTFNTEIDGVSTNIFITLNVNMYCSSRECVTVRLIRNTLSNAIEEKVIIRDENKNIIQTHILSRAQTSTTDLFLHVDEQLSFELSARNNEMWDSASYMIVGVKNDIIGTFTNLTIIRNVFKPHEIHYINLHAPLLFGSEWKYKFYSFLTYPSDWYGLSIDTSNWGTVKYSNSVPTATYLGCFVFRKTIPTPNIEGQTGWVLGYSVPYNAKVYINEHEIAVYGFQNNLQNTGRLDHSWKQSSGPISLFDNQDTITISVLIYQILPQYINFDAYLLMLVDYTLPIYVDNTISCDDCNIQFENNIVDHRYSSYGIIMFNANPFSLILNNFKGNDIITRYRVVFFSPDYLIWKTDVANYTGEFYLFSDIQETHLTKNYYDIFFPHKNMGINTLKFTGEFFKQAPYFWRISEFIFFADEMTPETMPMFSTSSSLYTIYNNTSVFIPIKNSYTYKDFSISPQLPNGCSINPYDGTISGILIGKEGTTQYTITAISWFDTTRSYAFSIQIISCKLPNSLVHIQYNYNNANKNTLNITNSLTNVSLFSINHESKEGSEQYNLCLYIGSYSISWYVSNIVESRSSYLYINNQLDQTLNFNTTTTFYIKQLFDSSSTSILYSYDAITPPKHWNTNLFNDNLWSTAPSSSSLPDVPSDSITQYYRIHYTINELMNMFNRLAITVSTYAGMIIYINGIEIRRVNMDNVISSFYNTPATTEYEEYISFRSVISLAMHSNILFVGDNIIGIEIHKMNTIISPSDGFFVSLSYLNDKDQTPFTDEYSSNHNVHSENPLSLLSDNNALTYTLLYGPCVGTLLTYTLDENEKNYINHVEMIIEANNMLFYTPSAFIVEGYNDTDNTWISIQTIKSDLSNSNTIALELISKYSYTSYRIRITECTIDNMSSNSELDVVTIIYELTFSYKSIDSKCHEEGWSYAYTNDYSYKLCPKGYTSDTKRLCKDTILQEIQGDNICKKIYPTTLFVNNNNILMKRGHEYEQYYSIDSINTEVIITPSLPEGIELDTESQRIYGTPTSVSPTTKYRFSYINDNNDDIELLFDISIVVKEPFCVSENSWESTDPLTTITKNCPQGYEGEITRYCNETIDWEEENMDNCQFIGNKPCLGTTYYDNNECIECVNGIVSPLDGNNYLCTYCEDHYFSYDNQCLPESATCDQRIMVTYIYPETRIMKNAAVNCTNENQYGYYQVFCDYIDTIPTWSDTINTDFCYPRPISVPGKALEVLEYSFEMKSSIEDIYSLLITVARTFIYTYRYQLTDLLLTTNYTSDTNSADSLVLHVYYGSNIYFYSSSSSSSYHYHSFINTIISSPNSQFKNSSLIHTNLDPQEMIGYCQHPIDSSIKILLNQFYTSYTITDNIYRYETYFCKQNQLEYTAIPAYFSTVNTQNKYILQIQFTNVYGSWIYPEEYISIYRSLLLSFHTVLQELKMIYIESNLSSINSLDFGYLFNIPENIQIGKESLSTILDELLLIHKVSNSIHFKYESIAIEVKQFY